MSKVLRNIFFCIFSWPWYCNSLISIYNIDCANKQSKLSQMYNLKITDRFSSLCPVTDKPKQSLHFYVLVQAASSYRNLVPNCSFSWTRRPRPTYWSSLFYHQIFMKRRRTVEAIDKCLYLFSSFSLGYILCKII